MFTVYQPLLKGAPALDLSSVIDSDQAAAVATRSGFVEQEPGAERMTFVLASLTVKLTRGTVDYYVVIDDAPLANYRRVLLDAHSGAVMSSTFKSKLQ